MKFSAIIPFAVGALAALAPRQSSSPTDAQIQEYTDTIDAQIQDIILATNNLDTQVKEYSGDITGIRTATTNVLSAISNAESAISPIPSGSITGLPLFQISGNTTNLNTAVSQAVNDTIAKADMLVRDGYGPTILASLKQQQTEGDDLAAEIVSKLTPGIQAFAAKQSTTNASLQRAIDAFNAAIASITTTTTTAASTTTTAAATTTTTTVDTTTTTTAAASSTTTTMATSTTTTAASSSTTTTASSSTTTAASSTTSSTTSSTSAVATCTPGEIDGFVVTCNRAVNVIVGASRKRQNNSNLINTVAGTSDLACAEACSTTTDCVAFNFLRAAGECELFSNIDNGFSADEGVDSGVINALATSTTSTTTTCTSSSYYYSTPTTCYTAPFTATTVCPTESATIPYYPESTACPTYGCDCATEPAFSAPVTYVTYCPEATSLVWYGSTVTVTASCSLTLEYTKTEVTAESTIVCSTEYNVPAPTMMPAPMAPAPMAAAPTMAPAAPAAPMAPAPMAPAPTMAPAAPAAAAPAASGAVQQISDGQIQAPAASEAAQAPAAQAPAAAAPAATNAVQQISDGQIQEPATAAAQAPAASNAVQQIGDGQIQEPAASSTPEAYQGAASAVNAGAFGVFAVAAVVVAAF